MNKSMKPAFVSIGVLLAAGLMALALTEELRVLSLLMVPAAVAGFLLVLYFDWRRKLLGRVRDKRDGGPGAPVTIVADGPLTDMSLRSGSRPDTTSNRKGASA